MPKSEEAPPAAPVTMQVIAHHMIYHTVGKPPALPGSIVELVEEEALRLLKSGAVRRLGEPGLPAQTLIKGAASIPPQPSPIGAEHMPIAPAPQPPKPAGSA